MENRRSIDMRNLTLLLALGASIILIGCSSMGNSMRETAYSVEFPLGPDDYEIIGEVQGSATVTTIFYFIRVGAKSQTGDITVVGNVTPIFLADIAKQNAIYNAIASVPDADALIFPKFETKTSSFPILYKTKTVKVRAKAIRLKIK